MVNHSRVVKLLEDYKEWKSECFECIEEINNNDNEKIKKMLFHSIRAYFLDFHILCEDYISISLKELNKFKIGISAIEGMETLKDSLCISEEFFDFYLFVSIDFILPNLVVCAPFSWSTGQNLNGKV